MGSLNSAITPMPVTGTKKDENAPQIPLYPPFLEGIE